MPNYNKAEKCSVIIDIFIIDILIIDIYRKDTIIMDQKEINEILKTVDHTLLTQTATWEEIRQILDDGITYGTASACIPAAYVK